MEQNMHVTRRNYAKGIHNFGALSKHWMSGAMGPSLETPCPDPWSSVDLVNKPDFGHTQSLLDKIINDMKYIWMTQYIL